jgi:hypothetical protein
LPTSAAKRKPHLRSVPTYPRPVQLELPLPEPKVRWQPGPPLWHYVLVSLLLHIAAVLLFGAPSGGSREGRALWAALRVSLIPPPPAPLPIKSLEVEPELLAPALPAAPREAKRRAAKPKKAVKVEPSPVLRPLPHLDPPAAPAELPVPPLLDRLTKPETKSVLPPPAQVPQATESQVPAVQPAAVAPPEPEPIVAPEPALVLPKITPGEFAPLELPALPPVRPAPAPAPAVVPPKPEPLPRAIEPFPVREIAAPQPPPAFERPEPNAQQSVAPPKLEREAPKLEREVPKVERTVPREIRTPDVPAARPGPSVSPAPSPPAPAKRETPAGSYDPTAPTLDLDAMRRRAGEIARQGTGNRALLPFPMPPLPEKKSKLEDALDKARKPDCRDAYKELGLAAVVPLIANEFGEGNCRW